jgi:hypothetical protein
MSFVPAGFWERFIARMLISLNEMDLQVTGFYTHSCMGSLTGFPSDTCRGIEKTV